MNRNIPSASTVNSVSTVISIPPGLKYTREMAEKYRQQNRFIRVNSAKNKIVHRSITGAEQSWKDSAKPEEYDSIFNTEFRITGIKHDVQKALELSGLSASEVDRALRESITRTNYKEEPFASKFNAEKGTRNISKEAKPEPEPAFTLEIVRYLHKNIKAAEVTNTNGISKVRTRAAPAEQTVPVKETLKDRLAKLTENHVLDVSKYNSGAKTGATTIDKPVTTNGSKILFGNLNLVSDNAKNLVAALKEIVGPDAETIYATELQEFAAAVETRSRKNVKTETLVLPSAKKPSLPRAPRGANKKGAESVAAQQTELPSTTAHHTAAVPSRASPLRIFSPGDAPTPAVPGHSIVIPAITKRQGPPLKNIPLVKAK